jgi:tetratricopeptide (TPR) repeat protein
MKTLILALGIALAIPVSVQAENMSNKSVAERYLDQGRLELRHGHNEAAEMSYRRAALINPIDPMPHYLLANLLARSDRHLDAIAEYKASLRLDPTGLVSSYCRQALAAYNLTAFADAASPRSDEYVPPPPRTKLETAFDMIDREAQSEKERDQLFASRLGTTATRGAEWKAREIQMNAQADIANMYANPGWGVRSSSRYHSSTATISELDARARRIQKDADDKAAAEAALAKDKADNHAAWARERQYEIDRTAGNLKQQLTERPSDFGFDLAPAGTGLYVRNYKCSKPKIVLPQPRFSVLRLTDPGVQDGD